MEAPIKARISKTHLQKGSAQSLLRTSFDLVGCQGLSFVTVIRFDWLGESSNALKSHPKF